MAAAPAPVTEAAVFVHATALVVGEAGVLLLGRAGSGKSSLAAALIAAAGPMGRFARLVGDDRVGLRAAGGRLVARPHPAVVGRLEQRGAGLLAVPHEPACVLRLAARLDADPPPRLPGAGPPGGDWVAEGVRLPLLVLWAGAGATENARRLLAILALMADA